MTDNDIIKALECCMSENGNDCEDCPCQHITYKHGDGGCCNALMGYALDLINRQKAEIERCKGVIKLLENDVANAKTETVKEFAHLLIDKAEPGGDIHVSDIPDYVIELQEDKK